jgi:hypothetical protein
MINDTLAIWTSAVTSASHSGSVVMQPYVYALFLVIWNFLNTINEIVDLTMKENFKIVFVNQWIANWQCFMAPVSVT